MEYPLVALLSFCWKVGMVLVMLAKVIYLTEPSALAIPIIYLFNTNTNNDAIFLSLRATLFNTSSIIVPLLELVSGSSFPLSKGFGGKEEKGKGVWL